MTEAKLQPLKVVNRSDNMGTVEEIKRGVKKGSPLSSTLFNLYMDQFVEMLSTAMQAKAKKSAEGVWELCRFVDDVKLLARSATINKYLIQASNQWATAAGMKWSANKFHIIVSKTNRNETKYELDGKQMDIVEHSTYLGVEATGEGIRDYQ